MSRQSRRALRKWELPIAPPALETRRARKCIRTGKKDAKKYKNLMDYTRTHGVIFLDVWPTQKQSRVNIWYDHETESIVQGIQRINVQLHAYEIRLAKLKARDDKTGRQRRRTNGEIERLDQDILNSMAQLRTNQQRGLSLRRQAIEAMQTWVTYRNEAVSLYSRARAMANGTDVSSVQSEIPPFTPIELTYIPEFEIETADDQTPPMGPDSPRRGFPATPKNEGDDR